MLETRTYTLQLRADGDRVINFSLPRNATLVGVEKGISTRSASITSNSLDINEVATAILAAICSGVTNNAVYRWLTPHLGGSEEAVELAKDVVHSIDINQSGSATATVTITLYLLWSEV